MKVVRKFIAGSAMAAMLLLGTAGIASATAPISTIPTDQVVLSGSCITLLQVSTAVSMAQDNYVPGGAPAEIIVNGTVVPVAVAANTPGNYVVNLGCPYFSGSVNPLPKDQVALGGTCTTLVQVQNAVALATANYTPGNPPAGIVVNGNFVPVGLAGSQPWLYTDAGCGTTVPWTCPWRA